MRLTVSACDPFLAGQTAQIPPLRGGVVVSTGWGSAAWLSPVTAGPTLCLCRRDLRPLPSQPWRVD